MSLSPVVSPYLPFNGLTGLGLNDGALYIGQDGKDPETYPQACFWDAAGTVPAAQPIQVLGGYPMRLGTPTRVYTASTYSMRVRDATGAQVFYEAHAVPSSTSLAAFFDTRADAVAANIQGAFSWVQLAGYAAAGDGGAALYRRVAAAPAHAGKFQSADGAWWELTGRPNVRQFGAKGDGATNDTQAFKDAMTYGGSIYLPAGTYLTNYNNPGTDPTAITSIPNNIEFVGDGDATVWRPYSNVALGCIGTDSGAVGAWTQNLRFRNIRFYGYSETAGLNESCSLISLSSVRHVLIEGCSFIAPRGDGVYIGSGFGAGPANERHNYNIVIRDCLFDGINNANRQGVSVIDCDGILITGCTFQNLSANTMPGSIDFEPNDTYGVIANVRVIGNKFTGGHGNRGYVTVSCGGSVHLAAVAISNNQFYGNTGVYLNTETAVTGGALPAAPHEIVISNNEFTECVYAFRHQYGSVWGLTFANNTSFSTGVNSGQVAFGTGTAASTNKDIVLTGNQINCSNAIALTMYNNLDTVKIAENVFRGATQAHIRFGQGGAGTSSSYISIQENAFFGTPAQGAILHQSDTPNPLTNTFRDNYLPANVTHGFKATNCDFGGSVNDAYSTANVPSDFPYGVHTCVVTNASIIGAGTDFGLLTTFRQTSYGAAYAWQQYKPATGADVGKLLFRTATSTTVWGPWKTLTAA